MFEIRDPVWGTIIWDDGEWVGPEGLIERIESYVRRGEVVPTIATGPAVQASSATSLEAWFTAQAALDGLLSEDAKWVGEPEDPDGLLAVADNAIA